jgi:hypothetical protein
LVGEAKADGCDCAEIDRGGNLGIDLSLSLVQGDIFEAKWCIACCECVFAWTEQEEKGNTDHVGRCSDFVGWLAWLV